MSRWFRLDDDVVNDPKVQRLPGEKFKAWINLLCIASKHDGVLPAVADVAFILRISVERASSLLDEFCAAGLIDPVEVDNAPMSYEPHNWKERQFKSDINDPTAADRNKRYRDRKRNDRNATVTLTPTRTETETETETEQKKKTPRAVALDDWPENFGDVFWEAYPRKEEKISAMKKLATVRKSGVVTFADLMAGVKRYCAAQREPQFTKQPTAWLNKGCWADEIKTGGGNGDRSFNPQRRSASSDFFAGIASVAADLNGHDQPSGPAASEVPLGRFNIDG